MKTERYSCSELRRLIVKNKMATMVEMKADIGTSVDATIFRKLRELVGDHISVMGDVPSNLFALGTPEEIREYVRDLVRDIGPYGLILCPGCDAPVNTKPENMEAFVAAAQEFGKI